MEEPRKARLVPYRRETPVVMQSRLAHEHDQNDAILARLSWYKEFSDFLKAKEEGAEKKVEKKLMEGQQKASGQMFNIFVWMNLYAGLMIVILKGMGII
jgi:hypothetical protein